VEKAVIEGMADALKDPRLIGTYVRTYNEERKRLAATANATRSRIEKKRDRLESERQRAIDMAIKGVIGEEDARTRIADLKAQVGQAHHRIDLGPAHGEHALRVVDAHSGPR
jgi:site-specific DNA recombinase